MGQDLPALGMTPHAIAEIFPESHAPRLLQHCYDEFTTLSRFLPSLYDAEGRPAADLRRPW